MYIMCVCTYVCAERGGLPEYLCSTFSFRVIRNIEVPITPVYIRMIQRMHVCVYVCVWVSGGVGVCVYGWGGGSVCVWVGGCGC